MNFLVTKINFLLGAIKCNLSRPYPECTALFSGHDKYGSHCDIIIPRHPTLLITVSRVPFHYIHSRGNRQLVIMQYILPSLAELELVT